MQNKIEAFVRDIGTTGDAILSLEAPDQPDIDGRIAFADGLVPGDRVLVHKLAKAKKFLRVKEWELLQPSPSRTTPPCPIFGCCGGCDLQHLNYDATLAWKTKRVRDVLTRIGKLDNTDELVQDCLACEPAKAYRSRVQLKVQWGDENEPQIGFFEKNTHQVIETEHCLIVSGFCNSLRKSWKNYLAELPTEEARNCVEITWRENRDGDAFVIIFHLQDQAKVNEWQKAMSHLKDALKSNNAENCGIYLEHEGQIIPLQESEFTERFATEQGEVKLLFSPLAFSQTNLWMDQTLYSEAVRMMKAASGEETVHDILELYCGSGSISAIMAKVFPEAKIEGVEIFAPAVEDAKKNAKVNGLSDRLDFVCADAGAYIKKREKAPQWLLVDPPRQGLSKEATEDILRLQAERICYISCDPASLARDLAILSQSYQVQACQPLDMFPWTVHVETVVLMSKRA